MQKERKYKLWNVIIHLTILLSIGRYYNTGFINLVRHAIIKRHKNISIKTQSDQQNKQVQKNKKQSIFHTINTICKLVYKCIKMDFREIGWGSMD
jgi:hypothetical protein